MSEDRIQSLKNTVWTRLTRKLQLTVASWMAVVEVPHSLENIVFDSSFENLVQHAEMRVGTLIRNIRGILRQKLSAMRSIVQIKMLIGCAWRALVMVKPQADGKKRYTAKGFAAKRRRTVFLERPSLKQTLRKENFSSTTCNILNRSIFCMQFHALLTQHQSFLGSYRLPDHCCRLGAFKFCCLF